VQVVVVNYAKGGLTLGLLELTSHAICSDPRDRVYAILSLLSADLELGITPNYSLSEEIYKDFVLRHTRKTPRLDLLRLCEMLGPSSLPPWVPDLSIPKPTSSLQLGDASGRSFQESGSDDSDGHLRTRGVCCKVINSVNSPVPEAASIPEILALCLFWEPQDLVTRPYKGGGAMFDAYVSTLVGGCTENTLPGDSRLSLEGSKTAYQSCVRDA
jgi:hypothetical protein